MVGDTSSRRRGQALEDALLDAAWNELVAVGYSRFTIEGVAARAGTSRPVIYRRWPTRPELAIAAVRHHGRTESVAVPDTGSVRDDLIELLRSASAGRHELAALFSVQMGEYFSETGTTMADLRAQFLGDKRQPFSIEQVLHRGVTRGEIDPAKLTPRIASLPTDLLRHELLTTLRPVPEDTITEIVDDIFLPLVRVVDRRNPPRSAGGRRRHHRPASRGHQPDG
jgi:AcrR family transcriptional regulator